MNRRTVALVGLAIVALPQLGFAQSNPQIWTWKLNLVKSKYPPVRSLTLNIRQDGQNMIDTVEIIDVQGNTSTGVVMHVYDGLPHPATLSPDYDARVRRSAFGTAIGPCCGPRGAPDWRGWPMSAYRYQ